MRRIHLFEFTDLSWYPQVFRNIQTDYLQFVTTLGSGHQTLVPLLKKAMQQANTTEIVDLCSGGVGPWYQLKAYFEQAGYPIHVMLTDKYPNPLSIKKWSGTNIEGIEYLAEPVDAMNVPDHLKGMRTLFEGFHHFNPEQARAILKDAADKRVPIGVFEASLKPPVNIFMLLFAPLSTLLGYLLITPFIKPRTFSRFFWTYLVPLVPLATCWDGVISMLRVYSVQELKELTDSLDYDDYTWEIGEAPTGTPIFSFTYLIGFPR